MSTVKDGLGLVVSASSRKKMIFFICGKFYEWIADQILKVQEVNEQDFYLYHTPGVSCVLPALIRPDICGTSLQGKLTIDTVGTILQGKVHGQEYKVKASHQLPGTPVFLVLSSIVSLSETNTPMAKP